MILYCFFYAVPTPSVYISNVPGPLYAGARTPLRLTCNASIDPSLASHVNMSITWLNGTTVLSNSTSRVSISPLLSDSPSLFTSTITIYPVSIRDSANFTCRAGIVPTGGLSLTTASDVQEETFSVIVGGELQFTCILRLGLSIHGNES